MCRSRSGNLGAARRPVDTEVQISVRRMTGRLLQVLVLVFVLVLVLVRVLGLELVLLLL